MADGFEEVRKLAVDLQVGAVRVGTKAAVVVRKSGLRVEAVAQSASPVDTGALRNSIGTDFTGDGRSTSMSATTGPTVSYGAFVNSGTSRQAPQPYMDTALAVVGPEFIAAIEAIADPLDR